MAPAGFVRVFFATIFTIYGLTNAVVHKRFEYKYSFKGPHLVQRDGTVPFWEYGGSAIASDESIRITPSLRSKRGHVWTKDRSEFQNWEIEVTFRINGRGRIGADGLAIWYTSEKGTEGNVFGSNDKWNGLGIFFDSFDNDGQHNNPYILAMLNDGTKVYDHSSDGRHQQLGGCLRDFRNKPFPVRAKVEYVQNVLTISIHSGMTSGKDAYELCIRAENVFLPNSGYFGVSAATGGLADDHDVVSFSSFSLKPETSAESGTNQVSEDEKKKFENEFDEYWKKLQDAKDEYKKEHPNATPLPEEGVEDDKWFESQDRRELKQIFDGQAILLQTVTSLQSKLDEIIGKQERTLSQISLVAGGQPGQVQQGGQAQYIDTFKRHEVDTVMAQQREIVQSIRDFKSQLNDIQSKTNSIQNTGGNSAGGAYDFNKLNEQINVLHEEVKTVARRSGDSSSCPEVSCASTSVIIMLVFLQIAIFVGYSIYKANKEASAKKFY